MPTGRQKWRKRVVFAATHGGVNGTLLDVTVTLPRPARIAGVLAHCAALCFRSARPKLGNKGTLPASF